MNRTTGWRWAISFLWFGWLTPPAMAGELVGLIFDAPAAREVYVAGSFDPYWQKRHPMKKRTDGRWHVVLDLPLGRYEFQFLVDGKWAIDPRLPTVEDGLGGRNNLLLVPIGP